jgi:hypothetical protein
MVCWLWFCLPPNYQEAFVTIPGDRQRPLQLREEELAEAILEYLAENPHAMDTLAGIAEWWIPRQRVRTEVDMVARVLKRLTDQGLLESLGTEENRCYRLKRTGAAPEVPTADAPG